MSQIPIVLTLNGKEITGSLKLLEKGFQGVDDKAEKTQQTMDKYAKEAISGLERKIMLMKGATTAEVAQQKWASKGIVLTREQTKEIARLGREYDKLRQKTDRAKKSEQQRQEVLNHIRGSLMAGLSAVGGVGLTAVISNQIRQAIGDFTEFEAKMAEVRAILGISEEMLADLTKRAREMGKVTRFTAVEVAGAFKLVAASKPELKESADSISEVTRQVLLLASAANMDMAPAAEIVTQAMNTFG